MNPSSRPPRTIDQHTVERNKAVSVSWHQAWGTPDIESAYRECLAEDFVADLFGQGRVVAMSLFGGIGFLHRHLVRIALLLRISWEKEMWS